MPVKIAAMIAKNDGHFVVCDGKKRYHFAQNDAVMIAKNDDTYDSKNCHHAIKKCCHT